MADKPESSNRNTLGKPVDAGLIERVVRGVKYIVNGVTPNTWFGPQQPLEPSAQEVKGREFDYPVGYNLQIPPRSNELITYDMMRKLADQYDLLRLVLETRKDQLAKLKWTFSKRGEKDKQSAIGDAEKDSNVDLLNSFFRYPDRVNDFQTWVRKILEDLFVIDAVTIYPRLNRGGTVHSLEVIDGATIKRIIDQDGRTPEPPSPAYSQVLHGLPAVNFTRDELIYRPRNVRSNRIYGYSPIEQIIVTVNIAMRRQMFQLAYYTEGNVPEMLIGVPDEWTPSQIREFQTMWDALIEGNLAARRHAKFIPGGMQPHVIHADGLKDEYDEWLARVVCYAFSVPPTPFVKQMNRATAQTVHTAALQEGLLPLQMWLKDLLDYIINKYLGLPDYEAIWADKDETDYGQLASIHQTYLTKGVMSINEIREELGLAGIGTAGKEYLIYTPTGVMKLEEAIKAGSAEAERTINPPEPMMPFGGGAPPFGGAAKPDEEKGKPVAGKPGIASFKQIAEGQKKLPEPAKKPEEKKEADTKTEKVDTIKKKVPARVLSAKRNSYTEQQNRIKAKVNALFKQEPRRIANEIMSQLSKGDFAGHPFRGNQYASAQGSSGEERRFERTGHYAEPTIIDKLRETGGFSFSVQNARFAEIGTNGYAVSPYKDREKKITHTPTRGDVHAFIHRNIDLLKQPNHYLGGWADKSTGEYFFDVAVIADSQAKAEKIGRDHNQKAIFSLRRGEEIVLKRAQDLIFSIIDSDATDEEIDMFINDLVGTND